VSVLSIIGIVLLAVILGGMVVCGIARLLAGSRR